MMKKIRPHRAFLVPFVATMLFAVAFHFYDPYVYAGGRPKFESPLLLDLGLGAVAGSVIGGVSMLVCKIAHRKK